MLCELLHSDSDWDSFIGPGPETPASFDIPMPSVKSERLTLQRHSAEEFRSLFPKPSPNDAGGGRRFCIVLSLIASSFILLGIY